MDDLRKKGRPGDKAKHVQIGKSAENDNERQHKNNKWTKRLNAIK